MLRQNLLYQRPSVPCSLTPSLFLGALKRFPFWQPNLDIKRQLNFETECSLKCKIAVVWEASVMCQKRCLWNWMAWLLLLDLALCLLGFQSALSIVCNHKILAPIQYIQRLKFNGFWLISDWQWLTFILSLFLKYSRIQWAGDHFILIQLLCYCGRM